jgi:formate hydrogenlyase subunit 6/NADH:ubiquinone oxidoreductase subunit I
MSLPNLVSVPRILPASMLAPWTLSSRAEITRTRKRRRNSTSATQCIDCGACVNVCPVGAIYAEEDVPEKWKHYIQINRDWYAGAKR